MEYRGNKKWVSAWGNAMSVTDRTAAGYGKDITFRYLIKIPFAGEKLKITLDNFCGKEAVTFSRVALGVNGEFLPVTFDKRSSVCVPAGEAAVSDALPCDVKAGDTVSVGFYCRDYTELRSGVVTTGPRSQGWFSFGNHLTEEVLPLENTRKTKVCYFLSDVSVWTDERNGAVVCYGDSITAQSWPEYLAEELSGGNVSVVRKAASGTRILRQYSCATYESYGLCAKVRFPHELPSVNGAKAIVIQQGINDIIHPVGEDVNPFRPWSDLPTAEELIDGLKYYITEAKKTGLKVYLGTLLPIEGWRTYAPFREELKERVNEFIRTAEGVDGVIDFDLVVRDKKNPAAFASGFDSGDHLHPSEEAYKAMAKEALKVLRG